MTASPRDLLERKLWNVEGCGGDNLLFLFRRVSLINRDLFILSPSGSLSAPACVTPARQEEQSMKSWSSTVAHNPRPRPRSGRPHSYAPLSGLGFIVDLSEGRLDPFRCVRELLNPAHRTIDDCRSWWNGRIWIKTTKEANSALCNVR